MPKTIDPKARQPNLSLVEMCPNLSSPSVQRRLPARWRSYDCANASMILAQPPAHR
jgi:hypothetical protein